MDVVMTRQIATVATVEMYVDMTIGIILQATR